MPRIDGDEYDNRLTGGGRADRIFGLGGPDTIYGAGGDDRLDGGAGHDWIYGDSTGGPEGGTVGDDTLYGRDGDDQLYSRGGSDLIDGGAGDDYVSLSLTGDPADDGAADTLVGGDGYDTYALATSSAFGGDVVLSLSGDILIDGAVVATVSGLESASFRADRFTVRPGDYRVTGAEGVDQITTDGGNDTLIGGGGDDFLDADRGADRVDAGDGDDRLSVGDMGRDRVNLGAGDDRLTVDFREEDVGVAKYEGGEGDDGIFFNDIFGTDGLAFDGSSLTVDGVVVAEVTGFESIELEGRSLTGLSGDDILYGASPFDSPGMTDRLLGLGGDDFLEGRYGRNIMIGGVGDDVLETSLDRRGDKLDGGAGEDRLVLDDADKAVVMTGDLQTGFTVALGGVTAVAGEHFESLVIEGSSRDDVLIGGSGDDLTEIGKGSDILSTFGGDDRVLVELDGLADRIDLGEGTDVATLTYDRDSRVVMREGAGGVEVTLGDALAATIAGAESFVVETGAGGDRLLGGELSDTFSAGEGHNVLFGRGGDDALGVTLDGALDEINGGAGVDRLIVERSRSFDDVGIVTAIDTDGAMTLTVGGEIVVEARSIETVDITGTGDNDLLVGLSLDDVLRGVWGVDTLIGGDGDDLIVLSGAGGSYRGGAGVDTADFDGWYEHGVELTLVSGETATVRRGGAEAKLTGFENVVGSSEDDTITGDSGDNVIEGGEGDDLLDGGAGVDTLSFVGSGRGVQVDLAGGRAYGMFSGPTRDVDEIAGFENVIGSSGDDRIDGDDGANRIEGGRSGDVLAGRGGADVFVFAAGDTQPRFYGSDYITDFSSADGDKIDLSAMAEALQAGGELVFIDEGAFSGAAGEIRYADAGVGGGIKLFVDLDGDAKADETILLGGLTDLARDDLILV